MKAARIALVTLASLKLIRFVTTDWLGEWTVVRPIKTWALEHESAELEKRSAAIVHLTQQIDEGEFDPDSKILAEMPLIPEYNPDDPFTWQAKLAKGLDCPHCVGFWIGGAVLAVAALAPRSKLVKFGLGALALSYVTGHISQRID